MPRRSSDWSRLSDQDLLQLRFCDLGLSQIRRAPLKRAIRRLYDELDARGIAFKPHVWIAEEWFSPDGVPGIAIPFYLAHPRLERLERRMTREVEGGNSKWLMRILRHEAGHALDTAYRLRRRRRWREVFGPASLPYPERYRARPGSRRYVHHLGGWYAQAHPTEDFAETFAVWLTPRSAWRRHYAGWPALQKIEVVDELLTQVRGTPPKVRARSRIEPASANTMTLAEHYRRKLAQSVRHRRSAADMLLQRVFTEHRPPRNALRAGAMLRAEKTRLVTALVRDLGVERYSVYQILRMAIERSDKFGLYVRGNRRDALRNARWLLARLLRLYRHAESFQISL
ncbi:MAG: putative zinc-binding metallopeptidase [Steroidobacteraceae bacterium]